MIVRQNNLINILLICIKVTDAKCITFTSSSNEKDHEKLILQK